MAFEAFLFSISAVPPLFLNVDAACECKAQFYYLPPRMGEVRTAAVGPFTIAARWVGCGVIG